MVKKATIVKIDTVDDGKNLINMIKKYINIGEKLKLEERDVSNLKEFIIEYNKNNSLKYEVDYHVKFDFKENLSKNRRLHPIVINFPNAVENIIFYREIYEAFKSYNSTQLNNIFEYLSADKDSFSLLLESMKSGELEKIYHITFKDIVSNFQYFNETTREELKKYLSTISVNPPYIKDDPIKAYSIDLYFNFKSSHYHIVKDFLSEYCEDEFLIKHSICTNLKNDNDLDLVFKLLSELLKDYDELWGMNRGSNSILSPLLKSVDENYRNIILGVMNSIIEFNGVEDNIPFEWRLRLAMPELSPPSTTT